VRDASPSPGPEHPLDDPGGDSRFETWLLDSMSSGVLGVDASGAVVAMNRGARRILGCPPDPAAPVLGRDCREILAAQPAVARLLLDALRRPRELSRVELGLAAGPHGGASAIGLTLSPVRDLAGRLRGAAVLFRDLAPIERGSERDRLRDRLAALGQMAAGLAHEIRNPLASMEVVGGLLGRRLRGQTEALGLLDELLADLHGLAATVNSVLDFVRPVVPDRAPLAPAELLEEALATALARVPFAGRIERDCDAAAPALCGDADQLRSALTELVVNALEAMAGRAGEMRLGLAVRGSAPETALGAEDGPAREVVLSVCDSGPGVEPELREKVFYPFFTTKPRGSGLGLASAQKIAVAHGGAIEVDSRPGACTFRLRLPVADVAA
jgi:signal transduction histidine kinase